MTRLLLAFAPARLLPEIEKRPAPRLPLLAGGVCGLVWTGLCLLLSRAGHSPSGPTPFEDHYRIQALLLPLLIPALGWAFALTCHRLAGRLGGVGERRPTLCALASIWACALSFGLVLPDLVVYLSRGFAEMASFFPLWALVTATWIVGAGAVVVGRLHQLSAARSVAVILGGLILAGILAGPIIR